MSSIHGSGPTGPFGARFPFKRAEASRPSQPELRSPGPDAVRSPQGRPSTDRLDLGASVRPVATLPAADEMVRRAQGLSDLIQQALARNLDQPVRLGGHTASLAEFVAKGLAEDGLSFEDLKRRLGS
ncbi:MAG: hypothetical protein VKO21_01330 [Candidatus Sericytochromatia bacterium]|nr:hypothetical protein [Candidatus Sericytochromatia bacterium]